MIITSRETFAPKGEFMELPKNIQDGADRAKELQEEYVKGKTGEEKEPAPGSQEDQAFKQDSASVEDLKEEEKEEEKREEEEEEEETSPEPKKVEKEETVDYWKQKFKTLEGKYNAEVPRYASEVRELKAQISNLQRSFEEIKKIKPEKQDPEMGDLDPNAYEEYGEDMKKLVTQTSILMKTVRELQKENSQLKDKVGTVQSNSEKLSYDSFLEKVKEKYPAFDEQDVDPDFLNWVENMQIDLTTIGQKRDVNKAVEVYKAYADLTGKYKPKEIHSPPIEKEPEKKRDDSAIKRQVVPPKSRPAPIQDRTKKEWNPQNIDKFYKDLMKGLYTEKEAQAIKSEIFRAQAERAA